MDVAELIQHTRRELANPDPHRVADAVMEAIPEGEYEAVLRRMLPEYVRVHMRRTAHPGSSGGASASGHASGRQAHMRELGRQWRERKLFTEIHVGEHSWKFLGDCTAVDLGFAENERYEIADATRERGRWFGKVRAALEEHGVATVAELPDEVIAKLLG